MPSYDAPLDVAQIAPTRAPVAGRNLLYLKSDEKLYSRNSVGVETLIGPTPASTSSAQIGTIANGDFESVKAPPSLEPANWNGFWHNGGTSLETDNTAGNFLTGARAAKVNLSAPNADNLVMQSDVFAVIGGGTLLLDFNVKGEIGAQIEVTIQSSVDTSGGSPDFFATGTTVTGTDAVTFANTNWGAISRAIKIPANHKLCRLCLRIMHAGADATARTVYIDTLSGRMQDTSVTGSFGNLAVGAVTAYAGGTVPPGYLLCDGAAVSRASYSYLFNAIGVTYGVGDGSTTFNVPNLVGRFPLGSTGGYPLARAGGSSDHYHNIPDHYHQSGALNAGSQMQPTAGGGAFVTRSDHQHGTGYAVPTIVNTNWVSTVSADFAMPPYQVLNYIIRAAPSAGTDQLTPQYFKGVATVNSAIVYTANTNMAYGTRIDPANAWNSTSNYYLVPQNGRYRITVVTKHDATAIAVAVFILKNGVKVAASSAPAAIGYSGDTFVNTLDLVAGDTIAIQPNQTFTTMADGAGIENTYLIIETIGLEGAATGLADTGWIAGPALQNGWTQYPGWEVYAYRKKNGIVMYKGLLAPGTVTPGTLMFTMPVGFRNSGGNSHTPIAAGAGTGGALNIYNDGRVLTNYACSGWVSLNNVHHPADG